MMPTRKSPDQRLKELQAKRDQLNAQIQRESAKARTAERKRDTRRKIIAGALALEHAERDPSFRETLQRLIREHVKESDRPLFDMPD